MHYISDSLYWIATGLLVPVILLLLILFVRSLLLIGSFFGQYLTIRKTGSLLGKEIRTLEAEGLDAFAARLPVKNTSPAVACLREILAAKDSPARIAYLLEEYEIGADKDLALSKTLAKMGPILGLMGTLIPMGPALVGLSTGDIASMAYNMQVAFSTTVVGLFSSAVGFITLQVKQRWYLKELADLEFVAGLLGESNPVRKP